MVRGFFLLPGRAGSFSLCFCLAKKPAAAAGRLHPEPHTEEQRAGGRMDRNAISLRKGPMTDLLLSESTAAGLWARLRDPSNRTKIEDAIARSAPAGVRITTMAHVRTAHYVAYRVEAAGRTWLARVGVRTVSDCAPADNSGFLGTSRSVPTGQKREFNLARGFAAAGTSVAVPERYVAFDGVLDEPAGLDVLWLPFLTDSGAAVNAEQWALTLGPLHAFRPAEELPVFTNRAKTLDRLNLWADRAAAEAVAAEYDDGLAELFATATTWGPVHGDAHSGNVLVADGRAVLFDFDTVCWAPLVWDLTHLLVRAGTDGNTGYSAYELTEIFDFTQEELEAAVHLRGIARRVARGV